MATQVKVGQVWEIMSSRSGATTTATVTVVNGEHLTLKYDHMAQWLSVDARDLPADPVKYRLVKDV